jgi:hypothetical protein
VGLPRESKISLAFISRISVIASSEAGRSRPAPRLDNLSENVSLNDR